MENPNQEYKTLQERKWYQAEEESLLFRDDVSESDPDFEALKFLDNEGTPEEVAENHKHRGNQDFEKAAKNKEKFHEALVHYSNAINAKSSNDVANSVYYSNRAACNLALGNYGRVVEDCLIAVKLNEGNVKAHWRLAKAYIELNKLKRALEHCERGLKKEPGNKAILAEKQKATKKLEIKRKLKQQRIAEIQASAKEKEKKLNTLEPEFEKRGIVLGNNVYNLQRQYEGQTYLDEEGKLHFPVLFLYEEHNQSDFLQDFHEDHTFVDHLTYMFPDASSPPWDNEGKYKLASLEIYVELGITQPIKPKSDRVYKKKWVKVKPTSTLSKVLTHPDYVLPQIPAFYIVVNPSTFRKEFLKRIKDEMS